MPITFYDKREALEYKKRAEGLGHETVMKCVSQGVWEVGLTGKSSDIDATFVWGQEPPEPTRVPRRAELPRYIYHRTRSGNVPSIMREGLRPSRDVLGNDPLVWTTSEPIGFEGETVLRIDTHKLKLKSFQVFEGHLDPYMYEDVIPPDAIRVVNEEESKKARDKYAHDKHDS